ncbi:sorbosone dehydrogenase family protein [Undibacterium sp. KW1]|uniref:PQQ-dependent sugar dehydrogenase n=1 Tax=Undibacterium sp. KW1 TaxID=2058624 RepID=UPI001389D5B0|nr:sorbosone dehydrogenase family protein [Undibacterium sp. KW1]
MQTCALATVLAADAPGFGSQPTLPDPEKKKLLPTVNIAKAIGWAEGEKPVAADGLAVSAYAYGLDHPRMLHVLPNGDVLVAESNAPAVHDAVDGIKRIKNWVESLVKGSAGANVKSADRITLLRGIDSQGKATTRTVFLEGLHSPFGMALVGDYLYVANTDAIMRYPYQRGQTQITTPGVKLVDLPAGKINHHWTKDLIASHDGLRLYVSVGSNSNVGENGIDKETDRAAIHEIDIATGHTRVFASGLRNANGLAWQPQSGALWAAVNERDELGNDLVPDYMISVVDGAFYGWPYSYFGQHVDVRVKPQRPDLVAKAIAPDYALGAHTASLGLTFYSAKMLPERYAGGAFIGQHGSWNRQPHSGYKVIFVPFANGKPTGMPQDVLTGFLTGDGKAKGRPVGVAVDTAGAVLVADDVGNIIWRVTAK